MTKKCLGCGAILQSNNPNEKGYIIEEKLNNAKYCQRCFKIIHYNEKVATSLPGINEYIMKEINTKAEYVYFMVDILNINQETISTYHKITKPKSLIISKLDIIPKSIKSQKIKTWLSKVYNINDEILFQSSKKNLNNKSILTNLENKNIHSCYIVGYTNSGKSSLINKLCEITDTKNQELTTCLIPNTTIDFISLKITDNITIIDSPGFTLTNPIYKDNDFALIESINPRKVLAPLTYQVKETTYLNINNLLAINSNITNSLTLYISNTIPVNRTFNLKEPLKSKSILTLNIPSNSDLVIKSVGFINIKKECRLQIYTDNKDLFEIRPSLFNSQE